MEMDSETLLIALLWLAPTWGLPIYGYFVSQLRKSIFRHLLWVFGIVLCGVIPLTVPNTHTSARWWLSLLTFALSLKMAHAWASGAKFSSIGSSVFFFLVPMTPPNPLPLTDPAKPKQRLQRSVVKFVCLFGCFLLNSIFFPTIRDNVWTAAYLGLWSVYLVVSGFVDAYSGFVMWLTKWDTSEFCNSPFQATGPRDFWSRRWNMLFRNITHACVFVPLQSMGISPLYGVVGVLVVSCIAHEYMVLVSGETTKWLGWMTAFFVIHALATVLNTLVARNKTWQNISHKIPKIVFIVLHMSWIGLTAPLFFTPALDCIPFLNYRIVF